MQSTTKQQEILKKFTSNSRNYSAEKCRFTKVEKPKSISLQVRLTEEQKVLLDKHLASKRIKVSEFLRQLIAKDIAKLCNCSEQDIWDTLT